MMSQTTPGKPIVTFICLTSLVLIAVVGAIGVGQGAFAGLVGAEGLNTADIAWMLTSSALVLLWGPRSKKKFDIDNVSELRMPWRNQPLVGDHRF